MTSDNPSAPELSMRQPNAPIQRKTRLKGINIIRQLG